MPGTRLARPAAVRREGERGPAPPAERATDHARGAAASQSRNRERPILLVDDDLDTLAAESDALAEGGFRVVVARDGAEAMRAVEAGPPPSVIVLDIQMPGVDGPAFALELRRNLRHVPLVVVTGAPDPRREADRCNAEAYLSKPFDTHRLVETVRRFAA